MPTNHEGNADARWHTASAADAITRLGSSERGLSSAEAANRLRQHGPNLLEQEGGARWPAILASQFRNVLILILLFAAVLSVFLGDWVESVAIAAIVLMAVMLGFVQEFRAERAIEALRKMAAPRARVMRDGDDVRIPARDLVPGDVILLVAGDIVPADARLLEAVNLKVDEAALTGESVAVVKQCEALPDEAQVVGDRTNMVFSGTVVTYGRGTAVVTETAMATEFGKVTGLVQQVEPGATPLQQQLNRMARLLGIVALVVVVLITLTALRREQSMFEMFLFGVALAVAVVPEALPAVVTISLALGVQRMARRNALVRHLPAVETLGSTSVICADKTGTLTRNEMTVRSIHVGGHLISVSGSGYEFEGTFTEGDGPAEIGTTVAQILRAGALGSDAHFADKDGKPVMHGDPTEAALVVAAAKAGFKKQELEQEFPRTGEIPFDSTTKRMTTLHRAGEGTVAFVKGAPEVLLAASTSWLSDDGEKELGEEQRGAIREAAARMAADSLRVIALAERRDVPLEQCGEQLVFLGLMGMSDPPRPEAAGAVATCKSAGIRPIMMTGDHPDTARAVARELGMLGDDNLVTGRQLGEMDEASLEQRIEQIDVYARVDPEHKLRVIEAWQKRGQVVAMTGDGVNDAPALKRADVGVAMGKRGTDVSRAAADITLTDDNFASIIGAVEEGRIIFANIRKYLMYLLSTNIGEIGLIAAATLAGMPLPLTAVQILYINLATDGFPALALSVDPAEEGLMQRPPRDRSESAFSRTSVILMLTGGIWSTLVNFSLFRWMLESGRELREAMAMVFVSLVLIEFFEAYSFRSERNFILKKPFANKWLNIAMVWELALLSLIVYLPVLHKPFGTFPLASGDWLIVLSVGASIVPVLEIAKFLLKTTGRR